MVRQINRNHVRITPWYRGSNWWHCCTRLEEWSLFNIYKALPKARLGRYAAIGNWDIWANNSNIDWVSAYAEHHVTLLINEWEQTDDWCIVGIDDLLAGRPKPIDIINQLPNKPTLALNHCPALFRQLAKAPIRLTLSGHAHGGQVRLPLIGPIWTPKGSGKVVAGWYQQNDVHLFVSRGVGWSVAPLRLLCPLNSHGLMSFLNSPKTPQKTHR